MTFRDIKAREERLRTWIALQQPLAKEERSPGLAAAFQLQWDTKHGGGMTVAWAQQVDELLREYWPDEHEEKSDG